MSLFDPEQKEGEKGNFAAQADGVSKSLTMAGWSPLPHMEGGRKYAIIVEAIEQGIVEGKLLPNMRLPTQREIAEYFGVTIATVTKAINIASRKGLVSARAGSGTYIHSSPYPTYQPSLQDSQEPIDLSLNAPPVSIVAELLQENLRDMVKSAAADSVFDYEPIPGSVSNRQAGSAWFSLRGFPVDPHQVIITHGAHEGLIITLLALTRPGDAILCEQLNYTGLRRIGQLLGLKLIGIELDEEGLNADSIPSLIAKHSPKAIVCTPATHNPTTATLSAKRRVVLVKAAQEGGVPIIEDDIYGLFAGNNVLPLATLWPEGVVVVTSLSKTIAPGLRVGYVAAPISLTSRIRDAMFMLAWTEPSLQAAIATQLIISGKAEHCLQLHQTEAERRGKIARQLFGSSMSQLQEAPSYHVWVYTGTIRSDDIAAELSRKGILVSPASHFVVSDQFVPPAALRISLGRLSRAEDLKQPLRLVADRLLLGHTTALGSIV